MSIIRESRPAPPGNGQGTFKPIGVILHGSRSGKQQSLLAEYNGTANWAVNNPDGLAWHCTGGEDRYAVHLPPGVWGWHARQHSRQYLGYEFAQPTVNHAITDAQVAVFAAWWRDEIVPAFPHLANLTAEMMPAHSETAAGIADGKSDVYPRGDERNNRLRHAILMALAPPAYHVGEGILAAMRANGDRPLGHEVEVTPGLTRCPGEKYLYFWSEAGGHVYDMPRSGA